MTHIDLFSGIGGFALAAQLVWGNRYENVGHSEIDEFCCKIYHRHFPGSKCLGDIKKIAWQRGSARLITGGFPCQPYSFAGKRRGAADNRALWPEMLRTISEVRPNWVIGENVTGIVNMELDEVLSDLETEGYETQAFIIPACAVGAPHRRDRVWIVSHSNHHGWDGTKDRKSDYTRENGNTQGKEKVCEPKGSNSLWHVTSAWQKDWVEIATSFCRVDDGVPNRVERLRALGNAIVPQVAYVILGIIKQLESSSIQEGQHDPTKTYTDR